MRKKSKTTPSVRGAKLRSSRRDAEAARIKDYWSGIENIGALIETQRSLTMLNKRLTVLHCEMPRGLRIKRVLHLSTACKSVNEAQHEA
jgi:hypothetical protein